MKYICVKDYYLFNNKIVSLNDIIDVEDNTYHHHLSDGNIINIQNIDKLDEFQIYSERIIDIVEEDDDVKTFTMSLTLKCSRLKLIEVEHAIRNTLSLLNL